MPKKKTLIETHAKLDQEEFTTLEQVWGFNELAKYGTLDEEEYKNQIHEMNETDLHVHARTCGLVPIQDKNRLRANLLREFRSYAFYLKKPKVKANTPQPPSKDVKSILAEGR